ncbi:MAG TPA: hypothetical protein VII46_05945 [Acidimicrobiales bacterium]
MTKPGGTAPVEERACGPPGPRLRPEPRSRGPGPAPGKTAPAPVKIAIACIVPALYMAVVWHYAVNSFWQDDWALLHLLDATRHGHLTLGLLWTQYNENRMLIPNLAWVLFDLTTHSDTRAVMLFDAGLLSAGYAFALLICRRTVGRWLSSVEVVIVGLVWFSLADWENAFWGFQMAWYLIIFFFMAMLLVLSRKEITPVQLVMASVLAGAASFSSLQGLFAWPVGLLVILWCSMERTRKLSYAITWVAVGAMATALYFWDYTLQGGGSVGLGFDIRNPGLVAEYFLAAVGNVFPTGAGSVSLHALVGVPLCLAGLWVLVAAGRTRLRTAGPHTLPFPAALILFALLFDASIALGRASLGMVGALASRYTMANLLLVLGIILFVFERIPTRQHELRRTPLLLRFAGTAALALILVAQIESSAIYGLDHARATYLERVQGARIAVNLSVIPVAARGQLVSTYLFGPYQQAPINFTTVHQDQLGAFAPGPYEHYRALGAPTMLVRQTLAAYRRSRTAWCQAALGETLTQITSQMGPPTGTDFAFWAAVLGKHFHTAIPYAEWDAGNDVFVALFEKGLVNSLLAYSGTIPHPATDLDCRTTRG